MSPVGDLLPIIHVARVDESETMTQVKSEEVVLPRVPTLHQNYPNPFNPSTTIFYSVPHKVDVRLPVYNTLGEKVAILVREEREAGYHGVTFDGSSLASGVCIYRLEAGTFVQSRTLLLLR